MLTRAHYAIVPNWKQVMIREIYMVSILQLQEKKKFNLPRNWQLLDVFSILYVMFRCSLERIGCYEWKETFASHQWHEFRLKGAVQDFYEESGPCATLVLVNEEAWATCPAPQAPPSTLLGPQRSLCTRAGGNQPLTCGRTVTQKGIQHNQCTRLRNLSCAFHPAAFPPVFQINLWTSGEAALVARSLDKWAPNWSLTLPHTFPKLLLTPETLYPAASYRFCFALYEDVLIKKKKNKAKKTLLPYNYFNSKAIIFLFTCINYHMFLIKTLKPSEFADDTK